MRPGAVFFGLLHPAGWSDLNFKINSFRVKDFHVKKGFVDPNLQYMLIQVKLFDLNQQTFLPKIEKNNF